MALYVNPRLFWCYKAEDMMHKVKNIAESCKYGTAPHLVPGKVMTKYVQGLSVEYAKTERKVA